LREHLLTQSQILSLSSHEDHKPGVLSFYFNIERSCTKTDCGGEEDKAYVVQFVMARNTTKSSFAFEIEPLPAADFDFDVDSSKQSNEVYAGEQITAGPPWAKKDGGPVYSLFDKFGNLATTHVGPMIWTVTYYGPGCMLCDNQIVTTFGIQGDDCRYTGRRIGRTGNSSYSLSRCSDILSPHGIESCKSMFLPQPLLRKAMNIAFVASLESWDFVENNLFPGDVTKGFVGVNECRRKGGRPHWQDVGGGV
jgi:hypothetical protein